MIQVVLQVMKMIKVQKWETNICLMVCSMNFECDGSSFNDEPLQVRFDQLLDAFQEIHAKTIKLQYKVNQLSSEKNDLEYINNNLVNDNACLKTEVKT